MSVILLVFMQQAAAARLVLTDWTEHLIFAQSLATLGAILGIALGYSDSDPGIFPHADSLANDRGYQGGDSF